MDDIQRGNDAAYILHSDVYKEAFQMIETRLVSELAHIEIPTTRAEYIRSLLIANRKIRGYLEQVMTTGKMVEMEVERKSLLQRAKEGVRSMVVKP